MSLSYPGVLAQQPSDMGNDRFSNTLKQGWANLLSLDTTLDVPLGFTKLICFCCKFNDSSYAICQMPASKGKAVMEMGMHYGNLKTDSKDFRSRQSEKAVSGLLSVQSVSL